jgi:hypothetical protein
MNKTEVALRHGCLVIAPEDGDGLQNNRQMVMTINSELMQFGYMLSEDAFNALCNCSKEFLTSWLNEMVTFLQKWLDMSDYKPFYNNFPETVMEKSVSEMLFDMVLTYWTTGNIEFDEKIQKEFSFEDTEYKVIRAGNEEDFKNIFTKIAQVNVPITEHDFKVLVWFVKEYGSYNMPDSIPLKENLCALSALGVDLPVKTPTDVLRIATFMSNGTTDLIMPPKKVRGSGYNTRSLVDNPDYVKARFKKFKRAERRYLLSLLDKVANVSEMVLRKERWLRLGEIIHPGEYSLKYKHAYKAFKTLRNDKVQSWFGFIDKSFNISLEDGLTALSQRPGEFARRLDALMRNNSYVVVLEYFSKVASKVSNKVLFELLDHFNGRREKAIERKVFIPGARKPVELPILEPLSKLAVDQLESVIWDALLSKFSLLEPLGKVWVDPELKKIPIPSNMKTLNDNLTPVVRGQRMPLNMKKDTLRVGVFYHNARTSQCIDLSAQLVGRTKASLNWTTKKIGDYALHSGDSYGRTGNVSEFMDFNLPKLQETGLKYIVVFMHNYGQTEDLRHGAVVGFQSRENPDKNRDWMKDQVDHTMKINDIRNKLIYCIIDIDQREYIIVDQDNDGMGITVDTKFIDGLVSEPKVSVYDLLSMHVEARGEKVEDPEETTTAFTFEQFSTDYTETLKYML